MAKKEEEPLNYYNDGPRKRYLVFMTKCRQKEQTSFRYGGKRTKEEAEKLAIKLATLARDNPQLTTIQQLQALAARTP